MTEESSQDPDHDELVTRRENNQEELARYVVLRFTRRLMELARPRLSLKDDPEDIVQSVFRTFFRRLDDGQFRFDSSDNLWSLLAEITVRKCTRQVRYWGAARRRSDRTVDGESGKLPHDVLAKDPQPEHLAMLHEILQQLHDHLQADERAVLLLTLHGADAQQISDQTGISLRTVQRYRRAIRQRIAESADS